MPVADLTVKLNDGRTLYFVAGAVVGDSTPRIDLLRDAIESDGIFSSVDKDGVQHTFHGSEVKHYHLG